MGGQRSTARPLGPIAASLLTGAQLARLVPGAARAADARATYAAGEALAPRPTMTPSGAIAEWQPADTRADTTWESWQAVEVGTSGRCSVLRTGRNADGLPVAEYSRAPSGHVRTFGRASIAEAVCRLLNSGQGY